MGFNLEFNWYLVSKTHKPDMESTGTSFMKEGYRAYPIDAVVPLIVGDEAYMLVSIERVEWRHGYTYVTCIPVLELDGDVKDHYTSMYRSFKEQQEKENHGGKVNMLQIVNGAKRMNFQEAIQDLGYTKPVSPGVFWELDKP